MLPASISLSVTAHISQIQGEAPSKSRASGVTTQPIASCLLYVMYICSQSDGAGALLQLFPRTLVPLVVIYTSGTPLEPLDHTGIVPTGDKGSFRHRYA